MYLSGGFTEETRTIVVDDYGAKEIPELGCTHEEADNIINLHAIYSAEMLGANRLIIHANGTDVIIYCIYNCCTIPALKEIWVRTDPDTFIPIHDIDTSLGKDKCLEIPFSHAFSGKDDTSFIYGLGKKSFGSHCKRSMQTH